MYKRDVAILLLSVFAVYFSLQNEGAITFRKAWYHQVRDDPEQLVPARELIPQPLVTDLNGDGRLEVVLATHDARIQVIGPRRLQVQGSGFLPASLVGEVSLSPEGPLVPHTGHRAIALAAGYLDPRPVELVRAPRRQVLVAVTAAWDVACFDHNLRLLWTQRVRDLPAGVHASVREVALHVSNHSMRSGDRGVVVVGGSVELGDLGHTEAASESADEDPFEAELALERDRAAHRGQRAASAALKDLPVGLVDASRHFTYWALDGRTGMSRWKQQGAALQPARAPRGAEATAPQHSYKLDAAALQQRGEAAAPCRDFRESVLAAMPHSWQGHGDTRLELAHFAHHKRGRGERKRQLTEVRKKPLGRNARAPGGAAPRAPVGAGMRHDNPVAKAVKQVLVAHLREGLEAVHLYSGRPLCRLALPAPGLHADVNGDGVLDHLQATGGPPEGGEHEFIGDTGHRRHAPGCWVVARSGIPPVLPLFNASICRYPGMFGIPVYSHANAVYGGAVPLEVTAPVFLPLPGPQGLYKRGFGLTAALNSRGEVTALRSSGAPAWQYQVGTDWANDMEGPAAQHTTPTLKAVGLRRHARPTAILAGGGSAAVLLSEHGNQLSIIHYPDVPALPLLAADFNGDGLTDIILVSRHAIYGWAQVRRPANIAFTLVLGCLLLAMGVVYATQQLGAPGGPQRKPRSTDRVD